MTGTARRPSSPGDMLSVRASPWRRTEPPDVWRVYVAVLVVASLPFFARGFLALADAPATGEFLTALFVLLIAANACILELPPYRFLHFTSGLIVFAGFFVVGPAMLALLFLSIPPSHFLLRWIPGITATPPLGGRPAEYAVPTAAIAIALGIVDLVLRRFGFGYPFAPDTALSEAILFAFLAAAYAAVLALIEIGAGLRLGWRTILGTPRARADLLAYAMAVMVGAPVAPAMARVYRPDLLHSLYALGWTLWAFGVFGVAAVLVRRTVTISRLTSRMVRQERLAALGQLTSVIAHQTRHHLGILNMSAYVLGETLAREPLTPAARQKVEEELEAISRTRSELDELLAQELSGGGEAVPFDLAALARECAHEIAPLASERSVATAVRGERCHLHGDRLRLKQAVANLLRNAVEASPEASTVDVALEPDGATVRLVIRDHGHGLSAEARAHLFEPLFSEKKDGLGMGLSVSRAIVEAHGGELVLGDASPGVRAEIRLPIDDPEEPNGEDAG